MGEPDTKRVTVTAAVETSRSRSFDTLRASDVVGMSADVEPHTGVLRSVTLASWSASVPFPLAASGTELELLREIVEGRQTKVGRGLQSIARALIDMRGIRPANVCDLDVGEVLASGYDRTGTDTAPAASPARQALYDEPRVTAAVAAANVAAIWELENRLVVPLAGVECAGLGVDVHAIDHVLRLRRGERDRLAAWLRPALGVQRPESAADVAAAVRRLGLDRDPDSGVWPHHPIADGLDRFRSAAALVQTLERVRSFVGPDRRVRTRFNSLASATGRMSCSSPDLHSVPRDPDIRACFVPAPGWVFVRADYDALELRIAAEVLREPNLTKAFIEGEDPHVQTAALLLGKARTSVTPEERQLAKAINYGLIFGQGARSFRSYAHSRFGLHISMEEADALRGRFLDRFPELAEWHRRVGRTGPRCNTVRSMGGRLRRFPRFDYCAYLNSPIQGTAADGMKLALIELDRQISCTGGQLVHVIHDEVLVEVPASQAALAKDLVENAMVRGMATYVRAVPVVVKAAVVKSWAGTTSTQT